MIRLIWSQQILSINAWILLIAVLEGLGGPGSSNIALLAWIYALVARSLPYWPECMPSWPKLCLVGPSFCLDGSSHRVVSVKTVLSVWIISICAFSRIVATNKSYLSICSFAMNLLSTIFGPNQSCMSLHRSVCGQLIFWPRSGTTLVLGLTLEVKHLLLPSPIGSLNRH